MKADALDAPNAQEREAVVVLQPAELALDSRPAAVSVLGALKPGFVTKSPAESIDSNEG